MNTQKIAKRISIIMMKKYFRKGLIYLIVMNEKNSKSLQKLYVLKIYHIEF